MGRVVTSTSRHLAFVLAGLLTAWPAAARAQESAPVARPAAQEPPSLFPDPAFLKRAIDVANRTIRLGDSGEAKSGLYPELSNMVPGSGWISGGAGYRHWFDDERLFVDGSAALSWRLFKMAQVRVEAPSIARSRVTLGAQFRWQDLTQLGYFGLGPDSAATARSEYRLHSTNLVGYATVRPAAWLAMNGRLGWLGRIGIAAPSGAFRRDLPATTDTFAAEAVFDVARQPEYIHLEASIIADTRDARGHPTRGGLYRSSWTTYSDRRHDRFSFSRYEAQGAHFVPVASGRIVFALHGWLVDTDTSAGHVVPFYLLPSLGANNVLRGYTNYRFTDASLAAANLEARLSLLTNVDLAVFADAGGVAPNLADVRLTKRNVGVGLRLHTQRATFARLDVAHGSEGWHVLFRLTEPLQLKRASSRVAQLPFQP